MANYVLTNLQGRLLPSLSERVSVAIVGTSRQCGGARSYFLAVLTDMVKVVTRCQLSQNLIQGECEETSLS